MSFQIPDWHWGKRANPVSGVYLVLKMVFTRISELLKVFIAGIIQLESSLKSMSGEATPPPRKINFGNSDNCANTFSLTASVGGLTVANSVDGNSEWGKSGSFSFDVPNGTSFSITSNGMMAYGCDYGTFSVFRYQ
ncbi:hypothetical protein OCZ93_004149 [Salmonella enterica]|nr:hypothetical protein [Salmonella enterica]